jgi:hypothetical protein
MGERVLGSLAVLLAVTGYACAQETPPEKLPPPAGATAPPTAGKTQPAKPSATPSQDQPDHGPGLPGGELTPIEEGACTPAPHEEPKCAPPWNDMYRNCGPSFWVDAQYLHFWFKEAPIPVPLLTGGIPPLIASQGFGVLNQPGTQVLIGNETIDQGQTDGARITVGGWLDPYHYPGKQDIGFEASYFVLPRISAERTNGADATGTPLLARPVIDASTGQETSLVVAAPGLFGSTADGFSVHTSTEMWGAEANVFMPLIGTCHLMVGGLLGFRYLNLEESLEISQNSTPLNKGAAFFNGMPLMPGQTLNIFDDFETRNNFYGGQVGANLSFHYNRLSINATGKVALGTIHQVVEISGNTSVNLGGVTQSVPGGLLALPSNSGGFGHYVFAVAPEGSLTIGYQITENIHFNCGYTFMSINNVVRPGQQIDRTIDATALPTSQTFGQPTLTPGHPAFEFQRSDFWAQGLSAGITLTW